MKDEIDRVKLGCYIIASNKEIIECTELKRAGGFVTVKFRDGGGIRLRESRVFETRAEAENHLNEIKNRQM